MLIITRYVKKVELIELLKNHGTNPNPKPFVQYFQCFDYF